jgi:hypothetical protein
MSVISDRSEQVMFGRMRRDLPKANVHSYCRAAYPPDSKQPNEHRREVISQPSLKRAAGREHVKRTGPMALTCDLTPAGGACKNLFQNAIFVGLAHMSDQCRKPSNALLLRQRALAISDNEGGAGLDGPLAEAAAVESRVPMPSNDVAEVRALHVRIIALENIVISLLADASDRTGARNGLLHLPEAGLHASSADDARCRAHGRSWRACLSLPQPNFSLDV